MRSKKFYFTLTFTHVFEIDRDTVYFSHCFPYTYTDLTDDLSKLERTARDIVTRSTLCRTLAGNRCEYLTITSKRKENEESKENTDFCLEALPIVVDGIQPFAQELPMFMLRLASEVDYSDETNCIQSAAAEIAFYYARYVDYLTLQS